MQPGFYGVIQGHLEAHGTPQGTPRCPLTGSSEGDRAPYKFYVGGSWDLVTTSNWDYSQTYSLPNWPYIA